ncbi:MAG: hypothetical protein GOU99_00580 [Candidatus Altiarchaeota archaeon]|nr:hypothetical protein [Candidatus Altiarchaeota archaeon]
MSLLDSITKNYHEILGQTPNPDRILVDELPDYIGGMTVFYRDGSNEIVINSRYVDNPKILSHELAHSLIGFMGDAKLDEGYAKALEVIETSYQDLKKFGDPDVRNAVELAYKRLLIEEQVVQQNLDKNQNWLSQYYLDIYLTPGAKIIERAIEYMDQTGNPDLSEFHRYVQSSLNYSDCLVSSYSEVNYSGIC